LPERTARAGEGETQSGAPAQPAPVKTHTELFKELVDWVVAQAIPGDFTFDCYFTNAAILNHLDSKRRGYVGDMKCNRRVWFAGTEMQAAEVAAQIDPESRKLVQIGEQKQWYFTKAVWLPEVTHRVRLVIVWERKKGKDPVKILVTNRTYWEV